MAKFQAGQSGNPNGRPKKDRALTAILETAGSKSVDMGDGKSVSRKRLMADLLWKVIESGKLELPSGKVMDVSPEDWFDTAQFLYKHIDGNPVQKIAPTTPDGENPYMNIDAQELINIARKVANAGYDPEEQ